jgi:uncharacterized protein DUF1194
MLALLVSTVMLGQLFFVRNSHASATVDVSIVVALDVSASVDNSEFELMREGLARSFSSAGIYKAISSGPKGAIAITVFQWSGFQEQEVKIDWIRVTDTASLNSVSKRIREMSRRYKGGATDIGGAIEFSRKLLSINPFETERNVIDIVGDGPNNVNHSPNIERDKTVSGNTTINGLAIVGEAFTLVDYYNAFIIGGKGAFVESAADFDAFEQAITRKLIREISDQFLF